MDSSDHWLRGNYSDRSAMSKLSNKIKEGFLAVIPPTLFFFIALHIVAMVRALMVKATGIAPLSTVSIAIAALILGKATRYSPKPMRRSARRERHWTRVRHGDIEVASCAHAHPPAIAASK